MLRIQRHNSSFKVPGKPSDKHRRMCKPLILTNNKDRANNKAGKFNNTSGVACLGFSGVRKFVCPGNR